MLYILSMLTIVPVERGAVQGNYERDIRFHQKGWLQPEGCCIRAHFWVARRQHVGGIKQVSVVLLPAEKYLINP